MLRIWDNSNIVEGYPGITLPLTFSFIRQAYEHLFRNVTLSFLLFKNDILKDLPIFENMVGLIHGRVYYNLLNWYRMMSYLPGYENYRKAWDQMIGISERVEFPASRLNPVNRLFGILAAAWRLLGTERNNRRFYAIFQPVYERYGRTDFTAASEDDILTTYRVSKPSSLTGGILLSSMISALFDISTGSKRCARNGARQATPISPTTWSAGNTASKVLPRFTPS